MAYSLEVTDDYRFVIVHGFRLPPGFNWSTTDMLVEIPSDYPCSPSGVGCSRIYVPKGIRYWGYRLRDCHEGVTPGWGNWAWLCYRHIQWDPHSDDLVKFMEMVRADLTDPPTE
jgi:hypothetical protein